MWPFKRKGWTKRQKEHRRLCRQEEKELEQLNTWLDAQWLQRAAKARDEGYVSDEEVASLTKAFKPTKEQ